MTHDALLARYDAQLRGMPEMMDAAEVAAVGPVLAAVFPARRRGFVAYAPFTMSGLQLGHLIDEVMDRYRTDPRVDRVT